MPLSITTTSTIPFVGISFNPSCSSSAVKIKGALLSAAALSSLGAFALRDETKRRQSSLCALSVFRRLLDMVDDEGFHLPLRWHKLQTELIRSLPRR